MAAGLRSRKSIVSGPVVKLLFEEISPAQSCIRWVHENAMSFDRYLPETMGPGAAFLDYDNDGWLDLYLVNSGPCDFWKPQQPVRSALYKNNRTERFSDVTEKADVAGNIFGMGVAVGDYDDDGFPDMFVSAYGRPILYHNNGDGTFTDVSERAGPAPSGSTSTTTAAWIYGSAASSTKAPAITSRAAITSWAGTFTASLGSSIRPRAFYSQQRRRYFYRASHGTDIEKALGKGHGVVATDINNDGLMDLFVSNDTVQNLLFVNRGKDARGS